MCFVQREASAESNDETNGESDDLGDEVSISPSIDRDQLSSLAAERGHHHNALHLHHPDPSQPTISQPKPQLVDLDGDLSAGRKSSASFHSFRARPGRGEGLADAFLLLGVHVVGLTDDGDVSSATAISADSSATKPLAQPLASSSTSRPSPAAAFALAHKAGLAQLDSSAPPSPQGSPHVGPPSRLPGHGGSGADASWAAAPQGFLSNLTAEEIQDHIRTAIAASDPAARAYRIKEPPVGRPVRIYADGVYDLLHCEHMACELTGSAGGRCFYGVSADPRVWCYLADGHMLQLRQCKLAFPEVYLMVGVCSDELVRKYKASPVMTSNERYESVRHCKWVDEVVEDAPWTIDQAFLDEHQIDYVAHDEEPYMSAGSDDVYAGVKALGKSCPPPPPGTSGAA